MQLLKRQKIKTCQRYEGRVILGIVKLSPRAFINIEKRWTWYFIRSSPTFNKRKRIVENFSIP